MDREKRMKHLVKSIRIRRVELGYSQEYMAAKMGLAQNTYSKIELGNVKLTVERLLEICALLDMRAADLIEPQHALGVAS